MGRFSRYCPESATAISSSVVNLKLLFSITWRNPNIGEITELQYWKVKSKQNNAYRYSLWWQHRKIINEFTRHNVMMMCIFIQKIKKLNPKWIVAIHRRTFSSKDMQVIKIKLKDCWMRNHSMVKRKKKRKCCGHSTWNSFPRNFCSKESVSSGERFCCSNFRAPCIGSNNEYKCYI